MNISALMQAASPGTGGKGTFADEFGVKADSASQFGDGVLPVLLTAARGGGGFLPVTSFHADQGREVVCWARNVARDVVLSHEP